MLDFTHTFVLYSRKTLMRLVIGMFSLFLVPSSAAQIDCCVTGLTGLNLQNSFAKFTWQFGKCEWSVDTLVFCWNQKGEQFLILYFPLLLLIDWWINWLWKECVTNLLICYMPMVWHLLSNITNQHTTQKSHTRLAHHAQEQHSNQNNLHFTNWKPFRRKIILFVHQLPFWNANKSD